MNEYTNNQERRSREEKLAARYTLWHIWVTGKRSPGKEEADAAALLKDREAWTKRQEVANSKKEKEWFEWVPWKQIQDWYGPEEALQRVEAGLIAVKRVGIFFLSFPCWKSGLNSLWNRKNELLLNKSWPWRGQSSRLARKPWQQQGQKRNGRIYGLKEGQANTSSFKMPCPNPPAAHLKKIVLKMTTILQQLFWKAWKKDKANQPKEKSMKRKKKREKQAGNRGRWKTFKGLQESQSRNR